MLRIKCKHILIFFELAVSANELLTSYQQRQSTNMPTYRLSQVLRGHVIFFTRVASLFCLPCIAWRKPCFNDDGALENTGLARAAGRSRQQKSPTERCPVVLHLFRFFYLQTLKKLKMSFKTNQFLL